MGSLKEGKQSGKGLKSGLNYADTGSVVNTVKGQVKFGRSQAAHSGVGNVRMGSANASMRKSSRGR